MASERTCAYRECSNALRPKQLRFCSGRCRTADWTSKNLIRRKPVQWDGPLCWCGKPARFEGFCGNHNNQRRQEKKQWRAVFKELQANFSIEEAKELLFRAMRYRDSGGML